MDRDIAAAEETLINQYGFLKEEVKFIMRYNPKFILLGGDRKTGISVLKSFFVDKKGF